MKNLKINSGAQTGADLAGLDAALFCGFETGGHIPKGFLAQDGCHPEFEKKYNLKETESDKYPPRTALNVKNSDATIQIATNFNSPGEKLTSKLILQYKKLNYKLNPNEKVDIDDIVNWIKNNNIEILNVAGNSERTSRGIYNKAYNILVQVFEKLK